MSYECETQVIITTRNMEEWNRFWFKLDRNNIHEASVVFKPNTFVPLDEDTADEARMKWGARTDPEASWLDFQMDGYMYLEIHSAEVAPIELFRRISADYPSFHIDISAYRHDSYGLTAVCENGEARTRVAYGWILQDLRERFGFEDIEEDDED